MYFIFIPTVQVCGPNIKPVVASEHLPGGLFAFQCKAEHTQDSNTCKPIIL